ncbi:hypothetical protein ATCC90586_002060 [Pythium insidiosum]|nr:hypothetical protein ATCC90586_002060 [Pythium insidiosum]
MATSAWATTAVTAAAALAVAVPLVYLKYQHSAKAQEREEALKLIRKVELIVGEVTVRLMHVENQVEDLLANDGAADSANDDDAPREEASSTLNSYYHFDSQGNKLKTKWDSYDVDAELEKLDREDGMPSPTVTPAQKKNKKAGPSATTMTKSKLLTTLGGLEHEYEAVLEFLDGVRGDDVVRETRKALVTRITSEHFARIDSLRSQLNKGRYGGEVDDDDRRQPSSKHHGRPFHRNRFSNADTNEFFEERKRERDAIQFSIWADIPSPPPPSKEAKPKMEDAKRPPSKRRSPSPAAAASDSSSSDSDSESDSGSDRESSGSESDRGRGRKRGASKAKRRRSSSKKKSKKSKSSSRRKSSSSRRKHKKKGSRSSDKHRRRRRRDSTSSSSAESDSSSDESDARSAASSGAKKRSRANSLDDVDEIDRLEAEKFKQAVQRDRADGEEDEDEEIGPKPLVDASAATNAALNYGKALRPGEGEAIAQYVQKNMRIPRRGEVGWSGQEIENLETLGYVMSGSRHKRMNAVRLRKENQVYTAEEKRALALINFEEKQQRENRIMSEFREMLTERLTKKHGARLVEDMESSAMQQQQQQQQADNMQQRVRVGIIGGGAAGVIAAKWLRDAGHSVVVFEKAAQVGGVWRYEDAVHTDASMYKSLRTNLPTSVMQLDGFPFPRGVRSFPSHRDVLAYIQDYAAHYKVTDVVRLQSTVLGVRKAPAPDARWTVSVSSPELGEYDERVDKVVVCSGHFAVPFSSSVAGLERFSGAVMHSHDYRTPDAFVDKRVLLIGFGPSGADISLELSNAGAAEVVVSHATPPETASPASPFAALERRVFVPPIRAISADGQRVEFVDGSSMRAPDAIMFCTGYLYTAPSLLPAELTYPTAPLPDAATLGEDKRAELERAAAAGQIIAPLYRQVFSVVEPDVAFIGLPFKNLPFLCFELQAKWVARVFAGAAPLPSTQRMLDAFLKEVRSLPFPLRKLHQLGAERQQQYFAELAALSGATVNPVVQEMFQDAGGLRASFPFHYRDAEYSQNETTGQWTRRLDIGDSKTSLANAQQALVRHFDCSCPL